MSSTPLPPFAGSLHPRMFDMADYRRSYVLFDGVECTIPRWLARRVSRVPGTTRGACWSAALRGSPVALHYRELQIGPAWLPVGIEVTAVACDDAGELVTVVSRQESAPYGEHGDFWRLTVNGVEPAGGTRRRCRGWPTSSACTSKTGRPSPRSFRSSGNPREQRVSGSPSTVKDQTGMSTPTRRKPAAAGKSPLPRLMRVALGAAGAGHFVVPLWPRSKKPAISDWEAAATRDAAGIREFWESVPYNVGIACGPSGLHVLDLDDAHGHEPPQEWAGARHGRDVLARLAEAAGEPYPAHTYTVRSPTNGVHLYFRSPDRPQLRNTVARLGWRIDSRGAGGYIVAAGSVRAEGCYRAMNRAEIAPLPPWLLTLLTPAPAPEPVDLELPARRASAYVTKVVENEADSVTDAQSGGRHSTLLRAASALGRLVAGGELAEHDARAALHSAAAHHIGRDGFTTAEAEKTITDGLAYGALRPRTITDRPG